MWSSPQSKKACANAAFSGRPGAEGVAGLPGLFAYLCPVGCIPGGCGAAPALLPGGQPDSLTRPWQDLGEDLPKSAPSLTPEFFLASDPFSRGLMILI